MLGITLGAVILQNDLPKRLPESIRLQVSAESDIAYALIPVVPTLSPELQEVVKTAVTDSLRVVWITCAAFSGLGFVISLFVSTFRETVENVLIVMSATDEGPTTSRGDGRTVWLEEGELEAGAEGGKRGIEQFWRHTKTLKKTEISYRLYYR